MRKIVLTLVLFGSLIHSNAQENIDKVIGVVGKYPILKSDLQNMFLDGENQGADFNLQIV